MRISFIKFIIILFFPISIFAQEKEQNNKLKNELLFEFNQTSNAKRRIENLDLSLEKSNELIKNRFNHPSHQNTRISPLDKVEEKYHTNMMIRNHLVKI